MPSSTLSNLIPNSLHILLYRDRSPHVRFHWGLYHFLNSTSGGWKFDIIRPQGKWEPSMPYSSTACPDEIDDTYGDGPLACAVCLGSVDDEMKEIVHSCITEEDGELNELNDQLEGKLSCRVYVQRACERMRSQGLVEYADWMDVEREVLEIGERCRDQAGKGPILIFQSSVAVAS